jgi:hypothetical protein
MKKFLFVLFAAMLLPMAMQAQLLDNPSLLQRAPFTPKNFSQRLMAPSRVDLASNQRIMGHYDTDDVAASEDGLGITGLPGTIVIGTVLTPNELNFFQGGKIVKFRVGLANATSVTRVFVAPVPNGNLNNVGTLTEWTCSVNKAGWNEIELATPYDINLNANTHLLIGFDYRQTSSNYPISAVEVGEAYRSYIYYQNSWQDVGLDAFGNLSVQCIVESDNYPDYMVTMGGLAVEPFIKLGEDLAFSFNTHNMGSATIEAGNCVYNVLIDGEVVTTISNPVDLDFTTITIESILPTSDIETGKHTLTIQVSTINGEPVENPTSISRSFTLYDKTFARQMHLVEEFTSNSCTYCPYGINTIKLLLNMRDDVAMAAIHGNQNTVDPSNTAQCDTLFNYMGAGGWPYAAFNRSTGWEDDKNIATGIGYNPQYQQMAAEAISGFLDVLAENPSFATININSKVDPETNEATITIDGQVTPDFAKLMGNDAKLSVYLIEDSLIYRQLNLGTWVSNFQHDHVFRVALGSVFGNNLNINGETFKNEFVYTLPTSWKQDKMEVIAFISRPLRNGATGVYTDMYVNQANMRKLGEFDEAEFMRGDVNGNGTVDISDAIALINYLLGNPEEITPGANCNYDETVNISDATLLINYLLNGTWPD